MEQTLCIIKPDIIDRDLVRPIIKRIERTGLVIRAMTMFWPLEEQIKEFYKEHKDKDFFNDLVEYMTSGVCVFCLLQGPNAINKWRILIGETDPKKAKKGTIRNKYGESITRNSVHGSDSPKAAERETRFFFKDYI